MEERLNELERQLVCARRQARVLSALVLAALAGATAFLARPDSVVAQPKAKKQRTVLEAPLDVVGADGKRLMTVEEKEGGGAVVWFYRPGNNVNAIIDSSPAGASLALVTPDGKLGVVFDSVVDGGSISIHNSAGKGGALLRATTHNGTKFTLTDKDGTVLFSKP
jgi:hypothetical protein